MAAGLISLDLDVNVDPEETRDFLDQESMLFPLLGMRCPVSTCSKDHYSSFTQYMRHWRQRHHETISKYLCWVCRCLYATRPHAVACVKRHGYQNAGERVVSVPWKNDGYVEPEGNVPPRKGSPEERQRLVENEVLKDAAARERRRRVMLSPEVPAGEGFSRDNFIEIRFHKGETFARRIVRGSCMNKRGNASRYVKEDLPYDVPPMSTEFLSRD